MPTQALYRSWRPMFFADVYGQAPIVTTLQNQVASGKISHAYLFCGSRGTGKTTMAKLFARAVNCQATKDGEPCGTCPACIALAEENNLDIVEIDAASNNGVDEIRDLREKVKYPPQHGRYRVYIIDEVHMLSTGAFNALLKTLEEPPEHALFILATTEPQRLPATVLSRVQRYDFRRIPAQTIVERLQAITLGEHGHATPEALMTIARAAEGGMRDAISLLDMALSYGGGSVDAALIREILGASDRSFLFAFTDSLIQGEPAPALTAIDTLLRAGREVQVFAKDITQHLRALLMAQTTGDALAELLETTDEDAAQYREQAARVSKDRLLLWLDLFLQAETDLKWSGQPRTALEVATVRACMPTESLQLGALAARIDVLEQKLASGVLPTPAAGKAMPTAAASTAAPTKKTPTPTAAAPVVAGDSNAIWERAKTMLRKEPQLYAPLAQGQFIGIDGDTAQFQFPQEKKFFIDMLRNEDRKQKLEGVLSEAAGRPLTLSIIGESKTEKPDEKARVKKMHQQAFDMFDRDKVQIVDTVDPAEG